MMLVKLPKKVLSNLAPYANKKLSGNISPKLKWDGKECELLGIWTYAKTLKPIRKGKYAAIRFKGEHTYHIINPKYLVAA